MKRGPCRLVWMCAPVLFLLWLPLAAVRAPDEARLNSGSASGHGAPAQAPTRARSAVARQASTAAEAPAPLGPLSVAPENPRYFSNPAGRVVYLAGSHTWNALVDMDSRTPPRALDFEAYLDFLQAHHHNFVRLWAWETPRPDDVERYPRRKYAAPQPWPRTGPGTDTTGLPRFDLSRHDERYFDRLRDRVTAARARGIYVGVMFFEGWSPQFSPGRFTHPLHGPNNINGTPAFDDVWRVHTLGDAAVTDIQKRYVAAVIDSVHDLDNVLYEIANEAGPYSTEWQHEMLRFVKQYESTKPFQHPVGMTFQHPGGLNATLFESEADWVSPGAESGHYRTHPEPASGRKVVIADTDHLGGSGFDDVGWVWRSFLGGLNILYMDTYAGPDAVTDAHHVTAPAMRAAIGYTRLIAEHLGIGTMRPAPGLASTGSALRGPDFLLLYSPDTSRFSVDLRSLGGAFTVEWFDIQSGRVSRGEPVTGGAMVALRAPVRRGALLYLRSGSSQAPLLSELQDGFASIGRASTRYAPRLTRMRLLAEDLLERLTAGYRRTVVSLAASVGVGAVLGFALAWLLALRRFRLRASPEGQDRGGQT